jgi:hypothetical protein
VIQGNENTLPHEMKVCGSQKEALPRLSNEILFLGLSRILRCPTSLEQGLRDKTFPNYALLRPLKRLWKGK